MPTAAASSIPVPPPRRHARRARRPGRVRRLHTLAAGRRVASRWPKPRWRLSGLHCAACGGLIEQALQRRGAVCSKPRQRRQRARHGAVGPGADAAFGPDRCRARRGLRRRARRRRAGARAAPAGPSPGAVAPVRGRLLCHAGDDAGHAQLCGRAR